MPSSSPPTSCTATRARRTLRSSSRPPSSPHPPLLLPQSRRWLLQRLRPENRRWLPPHHPRPLRPRRIRKDAGWGGRQQGRPFDTGPRPLFSATCLSAPRGAKAGHLIGVRISSPTAFLVGYRPQSFERSVGFYLIDHRADGIAERVARREAALRVQIPSEVVLCRSPNGCNTCCHWWQRSLRSPNRTSRLRSCPQPDTCRERPAADAPVMVVKKRAC